MGFVYAYVSNDPPLLSENQNLFFGRLNNFDEIFVYACVSNIRQMLFRKIENIF